MNNFVESVYRKMYPELFLKSGLRMPIEGLTIREVRIRPGHSNVHPLQVNLASQIGPVELKFPLLSAAMDAVSGLDMAKVLCEVGGCGILYRHPQATVQLNWLKKVLSHRPCLVSKPRFLYPSQTLKDAQDILEQYGFSTIPVITSKGVLVGVIFTSDIFFRGHLAEPVKDWMKPLAELKVERVDTAFDVIKNRLLNEQECSVLPVTDGDGRFQGIYFMKDFFVANPAFHNGKPLVGIAIGVEASDLERARRALDMGVGIIVIDSSHGNCPAVINQAKAVVEMNQGRAAIIAGNIADIDGYHRLAEVGVDGVKCGIGPGSICTTSEVTGAGVPMFTLIQELNFMRQKMLAVGEHAPVIIPDGGIEGPGDMVIALAAGGSICMVGKLLVAASESLSCQQYGVDSQGFVKYWGMASPRAIKNRLTASRYGKNKTAPEGVEGRVKYRGYLKVWIGPYIELVKGGFAHAGAKNLQELHEFGNSPMAFVSFTTAGQRQNEPGLDY